MGSVAGVVKNNNIPIEFANINLENTYFTTISNVNGEFVIDSLPFGNYTITAKFKGYQKIAKNFVVSKKNKSVFLNIELNTLENIMNPVVVTGTKTFKRKTESAVIVNVLSSKTLSNVQACNLSEGLKFQPGLRVETDCQTCNYTQLRINGLAGGYSQILINGRPIFSPLTGLYGMEQLPVNMIERIEVIRGGGSSLYGSSAIGGTVNIITKIPKKNMSMLNYTFQSINGNSNDHILSGNSTIVGEAKKTGISFFLNHREREVYDHNNDNYSEIPHLENTSIGFNAFILPSKNQKVELSLSNLNEFRYGGEMMDKPAYLAQQSEERNHNVWMGSADYQINFSNDKASFITYAAWQNTKRKHYTGIIPVDSIGYQSHIENPPYGLSNATTLQGGMQFNYSADSFLKGKNVFTLGTEYLYDDVKDEIESYNFLIDQATTDFGAFVQSDWDIVPNLNLLSGIRMDKHNLVKSPIFSPRISLLYKIKKMIQLRLNYGTGFRAPQAFDADLHIAFAGGGVSRIMLSPTLTPEKSESLSTSFNYDKPMKHLIAGFTIEGFYTRLNNVFYLKPIGQDKFGELFEKQNGAGATVKGATLELRANFERKLQVDGGFTFQQSMFDHNVSYINGLAGFKEFTRAPNNYGFANVSFLPNKKFDANINYVYTGSMIVPHFGGASNHLTDEIIHSKPFSDLSFKVAYKFKFKNLKSVLQVYGGVKNVLNSYQPSFDIGKNRDSNFVYGPSLPRSVYVGLKVRF